MEARLSYNCFVRFLTHISLKSDGKLIVLVLTTKKTVSARSLVEPIESKRTKQYEPDVQVLKLQCALDNDIAICYNMFSK
jgi:hypothetical protein